MLARNFTRNSNMNVNDIIQDNVPDKIFSSVLFTLVNLPYRDNSIDIENMVIDEQEYKCYKNHYRFDNGTMVIIKIASKEFVPFGIYARKIINFLISEFTYKMGMPQIYGNEQCRMIKLGKKSLDFIEKVCGTRNPGSIRKKMILQQLQGILNCHMAIATGYKQINPNNDELLAQDKHQFALIESCDEQLVNHKFNVFENWQEEIFISDDLAGILSKHIMPLDKDVYDKICSPMELDTYQYFTYQNYQSSRRGVKELKYNWDELIKLFGRGYAKTSQGLADFRRDFRNCITGLQTKINLMISAPLDSKYISFKPELPKTLLLNKSSNNWNEVGYENYKEILNTLPNIDESSIQKPSPVNQSEWQLFVTKYGLNTKFDTSAFKQIKKYYEEDNVNTIKTVEYVLSRTPKPKNISAFVVKALNDTWTKNYETFTMKTTEWKKLLNSLSQKDISHIDTLVFKSISFLKERYLNEEFNHQILTLIYARYMVDKNKSLLLDELSGSKYEMYFKRHFELLDV